MKEAAMQGSGQDSTQRQMIESRDWEPVTDSYNGFTRWRHKRTGETVWTAGNPALATPTDRSESDE